MSFLDDIRGRERIVLGCFLCQLGVGFTYLFSPLLREVTADLGWTRADFAAARGPYLFVIALGSPFVGQLTWRFDARLPLAPSFPRPSTTQRAATARRSRFMQSAISWC